MNDQRFFDLAMKVIARQCTEEERAELDAQLASRPELKAELEKLRANARLALEVAPLVAATDAVVPEFPAHARERLQTKVRQTLRQSESAERKQSWNWRWILGLAGAAAAVVVLLAVVSSHRPAPVIEVALLDPAGAIRGSETNELEALRQQWNNSTVQSFGRPDELEAWKQRWPDGNTPMAKVIYDRPSGEVRVVGRFKGRQFQKDFVLENSLSAALKQAAGYIEEQIRP